MNDDRKQAIAMCPSPVPIRPRPAGDGRPRPSAAARGPKTHARALACARALGGVRIVARAGAVAGALAALAAPAFAQAGSSAGSVRARGAGTFMLQESGSLHLTSRHGFTLNETGAASGTVKGRIYVHLKIVSSKRVTAEVNIYPRNGSITGLGSANYVRGRTSATFAGTLSIQRGSGRYSRAHGGGLSFSGTIKRSDQAIVVHVSGRVSD